MGKIVCFVSQNMADFELMLAVHKPKNVGKRYIVAAGYTLDPITSESGLRYLPDITLADAIRLDDVEALIIPGGPICPQKQELTALIKKLDANKTLLAAVCNGPQYLARAGILDHRKFTTSCSPQAISDLGIPDPFPRQNYVDQRVVQDGHVVTAKGRAFVDFAFAIFSYLGIYQANPIEQTRLYQDIIGVSE